MIAGWSSLTAARESEKLSFHVAKPFVLKGFVGCAEMAELADARGSGPRTRKGVEVRVLFSAPLKWNGMYEMAASGMRPLLRLGGCAISAEVKGAFPLFG